MEKVTAFLEKHVQWLGIGLGAAFVLWMVWTYVIQPPAQVSIGGTTLGPSEVDEYTEEQVAKRVEAEINKSGTIKLDVPKPVQQFTDAMSWKTASPETENGQLVWGVQTKDVTLPAPPPNPNAPPAPPGAANAVAQQPGANPQNPQAAAVMGKVDKLPDPPPAVWVASRFGRSVVLPPPAPGQPAPQIPPNTLPGQVVPGSVDKDWVTQLFHISLADLDKAFQDAHLPQGFSNTCFLQVEMEREELDSTGKPIAGTLKKMDPLGVWRSQQPPPPFPPPNTPDQEKLYHDWAAQNAPDILEPLFYATIPNQGEQWGKPGDQPVQQQTFDPVQYLIGPIPAWVSKEQKDQIMAARQAEQRRKAEEKAKSRPAPAPRTPRGPAGPGDLGEGAGGGRSYAPVPTPVPARAPSAPYQPPRGRPGFEGDDLGGVGGSPYGGGNVPVPANLPQPGTDYPAGDFDVHDPKWAQKNPPFVEAWQHDDTIQPGRTYHYRISYKIQNPIYGGMNVAVNDALVQQFAIQSKPSEWSSPVKIPNLVNFFVQSSPFGTVRTVRFDVFRWDKGAQQQEQFTVAPGDGIGGTKNGVDFSTGWTMVDFRFDDRQGDWQILIMNNTEGNIIARSAKTDHDDELYKGLQEQVKQLKALQANPTGAPGAPTAPGAGPGLTPGGRPPALH